MASVDDAAWLWIVFAAGVATIPFVQGFSSSRVFFIRDLSLYFWGRYLWLRRTLLSGEWPLWDPYIGGGQSAVADALHQMFLLPVLIIRLLGSEVVSFNLWVLLPFPFAAVGTAVFLGRAFLARIRAGLHRVRGVGTSRIDGNFPNMSWSVAAMPWVLWAVDELVNRPGAARLAALAGAVAFQALAGEPVTFFLTALLVVGAGRRPAACSTQQNASDQARAVTWSAVVCSFGAALAAIQLVPMVHAATLAERCQSILKDVWSLHPLALLETGSSTFLATTSRHRPSDAPWLRS